MTKHTPGPWMYDEVARVVKARDGNPIYTRDRSIEESIATARLIAAAPELLAACQMVLDWAFTDTDNFVIDFAEFAENIVPLIDEAVTKAKGETND